MALLDHPYPGAVLGAALLASAAPARAPEPGLARPTLLVLITVDQLTPVYFERFRPQLTGGLGRLLQGGAVFVDAHQDHAITETAPGHASTLSGRFPRSTGITRNLLGVGDSAAPLIGSKDPGASPHRFQGTTVVDWLTAADPRTRALSVSMKDRSAILPIGRSRQQVYWFTVDGIFTTSTWYADTLPTWVQQFNGRRIGQRMAGKAWDLLLDPREYPEPDSVPAENGGRNITFPHRFPADSTRAAAWLRAFPMMDDVVLQFALEGLETLGLGRGPQTDVLAVSLSSTDVVGHMFGIDSREAHDQVLRLDRSLGTFLDSLFRLRGARNVVIALTADHGTAPVPEVAANRFSPSPVRVDLAPAFRPVLQAIKKAGGDSLALDFESGALFIDPARTGKLSVDAVIDRFRKQAKRVLGVARVERFADFIRRDLSRDAFARRWVNMFPRNMLPAAVVELTPGSMYDYPLAGTHGSAYDYDTHVPMIYFGAPFKKGIHRRFVRTVDIAPTLAQALRIQPTEPLDGKVLPEALLDPAP